METAEHTLGGRELVLGRYELRRRLGGGGFGTVYLAHDRKLDRAVAVKRIPSGDPGVAERARREGLATARLSHPGIVALHETGADDDAVFLVSELVRGRTLDRRCADGELSDRDVLRIGVTLCDALHHAHRNGVVHRDVKPPNIVVPDDALEDEAGPAAKLTDFGIARLQGDDALTRTGDVVGTLAYMAPEQAEGREAGPPADLYALGLCLYEALAGVNPVRAPGATATARNIGRRLPALGRLRRDLPLELCEAIDGAVWPHPQERVTVRELRAVLAAALDDVGDEPGTVEGSALEPLAPVARRRRRVPLPRRVAGAGLAAAAAALTLALAGPAPPEPWWPAVAGPAAAVLLLPRLGWAIALAAAAIWLAGPEPGTAALAVALGAPAAVLPWLPLPPLLRRAAWGALAGAWLAALAGLPPEAAWNASAGDALRELEPLMADGGWWPVAAGAAAGALAPAAARASRRGV